MFPRNSEGIPRKHDSINTDAFDLKLLRSHCYQMIDCLPPAPLGSLILLGDYVSTVISVH